MDSQIIHTRTLDEHHQQNPHHVTGHHHDDEDQHHHEKKSVLKKVKAKAKKIKDTITKHAHDDHSDEHHDDQYIPDDHDLNEEDDDEEEEMVEDPEIHGAPIYESTAMRTAETGPQHKGTDPSRTFAGQGVRTEQTGVSLGRPMSLDEDPHGPSGMSVPSNAQSKVVEPPGAGTGEAGVTPIIASLEKMSIHDESEDTTKPDVSMNAETRSKYEFTSAGSHVQFNPEPMETDTKEKQANQDSYTAKISSATTAIADKAASAKNVLASKLGYGEKAEEHKDTALKSELGGGGDEIHGTDKSESPSMGYGKKIASTVTEKLSPVSEKVAGAGSAVMSKVPGTGIGSRTSKDEGGEVVKQDKGVSMTDYLAEKLRPGEEDKALSEIISDALHKRKGEQSKKEERPLGRVTESEEVARQLGTGDDSTSKREQESYIDSPGTGVIDKLKGAMGSWFGRTHESQTAIGDEAMLRNTREDVHVGK